MKIVAEDKAVESRTNDFLVDWEKAKPVDGDLRPHEALQKLAIMESKYVRLKDERDNVAKAKEALELQEASSVVTDDKMTVSFEELQDLKGVWSELSKIWDQIDEMKELPWLSVQPRKLRSQIDSLLGQLKDLPARLRQYASYEYVRKTLQSYAKVNILVVDLKSDALKERHWKTLTRQLRVSWMLSDLTLGQVWDVDLLKNESIIKDVIQVAQGEMALEEFLKQVKETWQTYELEMVNYQNKCRLIRGWDDLFNKVNTQNLLHFSLFVSKMYTFQVGGVLCKRAASCSRPKKNTHPYYIIFKRKPYNPPFESRFEAGRISVMEGSRQVLVKVVLFHLRGCGHPQDDAMPNFFPDSKSSILGLSNEVSFVTE